MIAAQVDTTKAVAALESLSDALVGAGQDASNLVRDETRRLCKTITNFTPPLKGSGNAKQTGEHAIEREFKSLFSEATPLLIDEVGSKFGVHDIRTAFVTEQNGTRLNLRWDNLDPTGNRMEDYHEKYQKNGKVPLVKNVNNTVWAARVVVPVGSRDPFIKKIQQRVGRWKASFALAGAKLGDKYPSWISRHFGSLSDISVADISGLSNKENPVVLFGSRAPGNNKIRASIQAAVNARARAMVKRVKLILSGYAKDVANGIRPRAGHGRGGPEEAFSE